MSALEKGAPLPESLGRCADLYHVVRTLRLAMEKEVEAVQARESEIKQHLIDNLSKSQDTGVAGLTHRAQVVVKDVVRIKTKTSEGEPFDGWGVFWSWVAKNQRFDMVQKRLADRAVKDWMEQEQRVLPGTEVARIADVSITKI